MDKPTKQPELNCDITITTIAGIDIETVKTILVPGLPETEHSDNTDVCIVILDSDTQSLVPIAN